MLKCIKSNLKLVCYPFQEDEACSLSKVHVLNHVSLLICSILANSFEMDDFYMIAPF